MQHPEQMVSRVTAQLREEAYADIQSRQGMVLVMQLPHRFLLAHCLIFMGIEHTHLLAVLHQLHQERRQVQAF